MKDDFICDHCGADAEELIYMEGLSLGVDLGRAPRVCNVCHAQINGFDVEPCADCGVPVRYCETHGVWEHIRSDGDERTCFLNPEQCEIEVQ